MFRLFLALAAILAACLLVAVFSPLPLDLRLALAFAVAMVVLFTLARRVLPAAARGGAWLLLVMLGVLPLGACASSANLELLKQVDTNFAACDRHITFSGGVGVVTPGAQISGNVDCKGLPAPESTAPASGAAGAPQ